MIILPFSIPGAIHKLEDIKRCNPEKAGEIDGKLKRYRAGAAAEKDAAYQIDFKLKDSLNYAILHGLRIEFNGRVAQIDHLIIDRFLTFYLIETKSFHGSLKIDEDGRFVTWNNYKRKYDGIPSPFLQNERHQLVLEDLIGKEGLLPRRLGFQIKPRFESIMVVSPKVRVNRPPADKFDTSKIVSYEEFFQAMSSNDAILKDIVNLSRVIGSDTLMEVGRKLAAHHVPLDNDFSYLEAITSTETEPAEADGTVEGPSGHACKHCSSARLEMLHGKYGYYFKCKDCDGNTPPSLPGKGRLRKDGTSFYFVPEDGGAETHFHRNTI